MQQLRQQHEAEVASREQTLRDLKLDNVRWKTQCEHLTKNLVALKASNSQLQAEVEESKVGGGRDGVSHIIATKRRVLMY